MKAEYAFNDLISHQGSRFLGFRACIRKSRTILFSSIDGNPLSNLLIRLVLGDETVTREGGCAPGRSSRWGTHQLEDVLGDTKPENFLMDGKGEVTRVEPSRIQNHR